MKGYILCTFFHVHKMAPWLILCSKDEVIVWYPTLSIGKIGNSQMWIPHNPHEIWTRISQLCTFLSFHVCVCICKLLGLVHAKYMIYHWVTLPDPDLHFSTIKSHFQLVFTRFALPKPSRSTLIVLRIDCIASLPTPPPCSAVAGCNFNDFQLGEWWGWCTRLWEWEDIVHNLKNA